jgi:hypothetical protein
LLDIVVWGFTFIHTGYALGTESIALIAIAT